MTLKGVDFSSLDGRGLRVGICRARWNAQIVDSLRDGCVHVLLQNGVLQQDVVELTVPGSFELPLAAKQLVERDQVDVVVCIGCLIKGDTMHFEYISEAVSQGIMRVGLDAGVPVIFGVLTCLSEHQARVRAGLCGEKGGNHGEDWGKSAIEMGRLCRRDEKD